MIQSCSIQFSEKITPVQEDPEYPDSESNGAEGFSNE